MGKSISKAFKKVVSSVGLSQDAPKVVQQDATVPAADAPVAEDTVETVDTTDTASDQKKTKRSGKRGLQVSRSSGGGISI